jgi:NADPH-dependent curcumin reductase CurA
MPQSDTVNRRVVAARPRGLPTAQDFRLDEATVPTPKEGQVLPLLNIGARVPVCGLIVHYSDETPPPGPNQLPPLMSTLLQRRIRMQGFIIRDHYAERFDAFRRDMGEWVGTGRVKLREDLVDGLENAPAAFIGLLEGRNFGKLVVRVADA